MGYLYDWLGVTPVALGVGLGGVVLFILIMVGIKWSIFKDQTYVELMENRIFTQVLNFILPAYSYEKSTSQELYFQNDANQRYCIHLTVTPLEAYGTSQLPQTLVDVNTLLHKDVIQFVIKQLTGLYPYSRVSVYTKYQFYNRTLVVMDLVEPLSLKDQQELYPFRLAVSIDALEPKK